MRPFQTPLFPLHTVLFPGGPLPLRVFEARYLDMVSDCLKRGVPFGVCLIREGHEVGGPATTHEVGTLARIADWHAGPDGVLGIVAHGTERFRIAKSTVGPSGLATAEVVALEEGSGQPVPARHRALVTLLKEVFPAGDSRYRGLAERFGDARWVAWRLAELLPLRPAQKQYFLQVDDPMQRLDRLAQVVEEMDGH